MGIRSLVSFGLLIVPVAVTVGVLVGFDAYRTATGQDRLFVDNRVTTDTYCQKAFGITPQSQGEQYTLNPNQWGWNEGEAGSLCMNVTAYHNGSYPTNASAPEFSVTWQYPQASSSQPVHAFPNIKLDGPNIFPVQISTINNVDVDIHWTYGVGDKTADSVDVAALNSVSLVANAAMDMFFDSDKTKAQSPTDSSYEVMVWLGAFKPDTAQPVGMSNGVKATQVINGVTFNLYFGQNAFGQSVLTWLATTMVEEFTGNIEPLITTLPSVSGVTAPGASDYLGYVGFGSEAYYSLQNVTFHVPKLSIKVLT